VTTGEADYEIELSDLEKQVLREVREEQEVPPAFRAPSAQEDPATDRQLAVIQARAAEADLAESGEVQGTVATGDTVELLGKSFRIADRIGLMPMLKYSAALDGARELDQRALAAIYAMLRDCIHPGTPACGSCAHCKKGNEGQCAFYDPGDWGAFEDWAMESRAEADDLIEFIQKTTEIIAGRPTAPRDGSSAGQRATPGGSTGNSSAKRTRGSRR